MNKIRVPPGFCQDCFPNKICRASVTIPTEKKKNWLPDNMAGDMKDKAGDLKLYPDTGFDCICRDVDVVDVDCDAHDDGYDGGDIVLSD